MSLYPPIPARCRGFNLIELLIALGIFAIGFVSAAAIFPTAIMLQKQTVDAIESEQAARNIEWLLRGRPFTFDPGSPATGDLEDHYTDLTAGGNPLTDVSEVAAAKLNTKWTSADRSYPRASTEATKGKFFWYPLIQDANGDPTSPDWRVFAFIVDANSDETEPTPIPNTAASFNSFNTITLGGGITASDIFDIGDKFLDNNGFIYTVQGMNGSDITVTGIVFNTPALTRIWHYAKPSAGKNNPTRDILIITNAVVDPTP